jgi:hypothetical protein
MTARNAEMRYRKGRQRAHKSTDFNVRRVGWEARMAPMQKQGWDLIWPMLSSATAACRYLDVNCLKNKCLEAGEAGRKPASCVKLGKYERQPFSLSLSLVSLRLMYGYLSLVLSAKAALMKNTGMQGSGMGPMRSGGVYGERPTSRDHGHGLLSQTRSVVLNIYLLRTRDATPALASPEAATGT